MTVLADIQFATGLAAIGLGLLLWAGLWYWLGYARGHRSGVRLERVRRRRYDREAAERAYES